MRLEHGIGVSHSQGGGSDVRVVSEGGEDTVWVGGDRCTQGLEVGKGEKGPPRRVALINARRRRKDVKARVVPSGPIEESEAATIQTLDKRDEVGKGPTRKLKLAKHSSAGDIIEGVGHVHLKHTTQSGWRSRAARNA